MEAVRARVQKIIGDQLGVGAEQVVPEASLLDDLGADSLDVVELAMTLEEEFSIQVPDEELEKIRTVQDVVNYIGAVAA